MQTTFRFQIGDIVTVKTLAGWGERNWAPPTQLLILGRVWEECPGGVQKHYKIRAINKGQFVENSFVMQLISMLEEELVEYPPEPEKKNGNGS